MPRLTPMTNPTPPRGKRNAIGAPTSTKTTHATASENFLWTSTKYLSRVFSCISICSRASARRDLKRWASTESTPGVDGRGVARDDGRGEGVVGRGDATVGREAPFWR